MLVNNFSIGIFGGLMALGAYTGVGPLVTALSKALSSGVDFLVNAKLLPLVNIIIEPGKVLFLNNAINHGIITPIASEEALRIGKSMLYMLESNPGPGSWHSACLLARRTRFGEAIRSGCGHYPLLRRDS
ncbi:hypothetical protein HMSSN036_84300 [Paenibacillus macerans]|nr:hypothetical protein HMSSN036_84300 [Paenibacillus macerans]